MSVETNPEANPVARLSAFFAQKVAWKLSTEIAEYSERNGVPLKEVQLYVGANKAQSRFRFRLMHVVEGVPIVGAPIRVFSIELKI